MDLVKPVSPVSRHVAVLMGELMLQIREIFAAEDWQGLRQSHFRLLSMIPEHGVSITELGELLGMTKQGCGQFVAFLADSGYLLVTENPDDRRVRLVQRTALGDRTVQAVDKRIYRIEQQWAEQVGARRYATFRRVLIPMMRPGVMAGWIILVTIFLREFSATLFLYSPGAEPLGPLLYFLYLDGMRGRVAAIGLVISVISVILIAIAQRYSRWETN